MDSDRQKIQFGWVNDATGIMYQLDDEFSSGISPAGLGPQIIAVPEPSSAAILALSLGFPSVVRRSKLRNF